MTDEQTESFLWLYLAFGLYYVLSDGNLNILTDKIILKAHSEEREKIALSTYLLLGVLINMGLSRPLFGFLFFLGSLFILQ